MNKTVYSFINPDKNPKVGYILYLPLYGSPYRIFFFDHIPWIGFNLFHAKGDSLLGNIYIQDHSIHYPTDVQDL